MDLHPDQMIISKLEYDMYIEEKEQFKKDKKKHEDENLVLVVSTSMFGRSNSWKPMSTVIKGVEKRTEERTLEKLSRMSLLQLIKWRKG